MKRILKRKKMITITLSMMFSYNYNLNNIIFMLFDVIIHESLTSTDQTVGIY